MKTHKKDHNDSNINKGFWAAIGRLIRQLIDASLKIKILVISVCIIFLIIILIFFAYLLDRPSLIHIIPFTNENAATWANMWLSYFSLVATIFLDILAFSFAIFTYNQERQYKQYGRLYFNKVYLTTRTGINNNEHLFRLELQDMNSSLTRHQNIELNRIDFYAVINPEILNTADVLKKTIPNIQNQQDLKLIYSNCNNASKLNEYETRSSQGVYSVILNFTSTETFLNEYFYFNRNIRKVRPNDRDSHFIPVALDKRIIYINLEFKIIPIDTRRVNRLTYALLPPNPIYIRLLALQTNTDSDEIDFKTYTVSALKTENIEL